MHDAILCSEAGVPATVVVTRPFAFLAKHTGKNLGAPEFEAMVIDHPIWTRDDAWLDAAAEKLAEPLIALLFSATQSSKS